MDKPTFLLLASLVIGGSGVYAQELPNLDKPDSRASTVIEAPLSLPVEGFANPLSLRQISDATSSLDLERKVIFFGPPKKTLENDFPDYALWIRRFAERNNGKIGFFEADPDKNLELVFRYQLISNGNLAPRTFFLTGNKINDALTYSATDIVGLAELLSKAYFNGELTPSPYLKIPSGEGIDFLERILACQDKVILTFGFKECGPCRRLKENELYPSWQKGLKEKSAFTDILIVECDSKKNREIFKKYTDERGAVPLTIFFRDGKEVHRFVGYTSGLLAEEFKQSGF